MMYRYSCTCQDPFFFLTEELTTCPFCTDGEIVLEAKHQELIPTNSLKFEHTDFQDICIIEENTIHPIFHTTYVNEHGCPVLGITTSKEKAVSLAIGLGFSGKASHLLFKKGEGRTTTDDFVTIINRKNAV